MSLLSSEALTILLSNSTVTTVAGVVALLVLAYLTIPQAQRNQQIIALGEQLQEQDEIVEELPEEDLEPVDLLT